MALTNHSAQLVPEDQESRTLYVGSLPQEITELLLCDLFGNLGNVISCKIIRDVNDPYCFIEYDDHKSALTAKTTMDGRQLLGKILKVNWATSTSHAPKIDTTRHYHIFVGDINTDITTQKLREAFKTFGEISDCRVVKDPQTLKSRGYGFVSFVNKEEAETAINAMNGQWLGNRTIRTNWAARKPFNNPGNFHGGYTATITGNGSSSTYDPHPNSNYLINNEASALFNNLKNNYNNFGGGINSSNNYNNNYHHHLSTKSLNGVVQHHNNNNNNNNNVIYNNNNNLSGNQQPQQQQHQRRRHALTFKEVFNQASPQNCTVYCGGIRFGLTEQLIRETFIKYGDIVDIRIFCEKGFAFIKFATKDAACRAILDGNNADVLGFTIRCSWGKETTDLSSALSAGGTHFSYPPQQIQPSSLTINGSGSLLAPPPPYNLNLNPHHPNDAIALHQSNLAAQQQLLIPQQQQHYYALATPHGLGAYVIQAPPLSLYSGKQFQQIQDPHGRDQNTSVVTNHGLPVQQGAHLTTGPVNALQFQQQLAAALQQTHQLQYLNLGPVIYTPTLGPAPPTLLKNEGCEGPNISRRNGSDGLNGTPLTPGNAHHHLMLNPVPPPLISSPAGVPMNPGPSGLASTSLTAMPNYAYGYSPYWYASPTVPYNQPIVTQYLQQPPNQAVPNPVTPQGLGMLPAGWSPLIHHLNNNNNSNTNLHPQLNMIQSQPITLPAVPITPVQPYPTAH